MSIPPEDLRALHDATFVRLELEWAGGDATVRLRTAAGEKVLEVAAVTRLECPRVHPWGPSVSVNEVRETPANAGVRVEIEIQSGDVVVLEGAASSLGGG